MQARPWRESTTRVSNFDTEKGKPCFIVFQLETWFLSELAPSLNRGSRPPPRDHRLVSLAQRRIALVHLHSSGGRRQRGRRTAARRRPGGGCHAGGHAGGVRRPRRQRADAGAHASRGIPQHGAQRREMDPELTLLLGFSRLVYSGFIFGCSGLKLFLKLRLAATSI